MTGIEFGKKCDGVVLHCLAKGKVEREGEHSLVTLKQRASEEWEGIETTEVLRWITRMGWRICTANGTAIV